MCLRIAYCVSHLVQLFKHANNKTIKYWFDVIKPREDDNDIVVAALSKGEGSICIFVVRLSVLNFKPWNY